MKLFPVIVKRTTVIQGGSGPNPTDTFAINIRIPDTIQSLSDSTSFSFLFPDQLAVQTDTLAIKFTFPDSNEVLTDLFRELGIRHADQIVAMTDALRLALTHSDTVPTLSDLVARLRIEGLGDINDVLTDALTILRIVHGDVNPALTDASTYVLRTTYNDPNIAPVDALSNLRFSGLDDANNIPTDGRSVTIRYWAATTTDNDSSQTTPVNANGANNNVRAVVKTNNSLGDLTNPVILTTTSFSVPAAAPPGTISDKRFRVWFNIPARTASLDTVRLFYNTGGGDSIVYSHAGTAAVNHDNGTFTFGASGFTQTDLVNTDLKASYTAQVVATPETRINLDAWCVEYDTSF